LYILILKDKVVPVLIKYHAMKSFPVLNYYHAMKVYGGVEVELQAFLTSSLHGGECSASSPSCLTPGERALVPFG
jgi:hypothetical protein